MHGIRSLALCNVPPGLEASQTGLKRVFALALQAGIPAAALERGKKARRPKSGTAGTTWFSALPAADQAGPDGGEIRL